MQNIMLDIETLGTSHNSVILSIGAVEFDNENLGAEFEVYIDPESCTDHGLVIDARTVMWWLGQSEAARGELLKRKGVSLDEALVKLHNAFDWKGKQVWCNGTDFDFPIIASACKAVGILEPWQYWSKMDYRTLKNLVPKKTLQAIRDEIVGNYTAHSALDDAKEQALTTIGILNYLGGE